MAVPVGTPDHALLTRARDGDGEAFEALYRRHHRAATRAAHSYSSRSQLAEDAVQEAFLRILHATQQGGGPQTEFRAYLATTVRHVIAGWTRADPTIAVEDLETVSGEDTRDSAQPESRLRWHLLTKAFKSLPTRWQEALWLGEVEGVEPAELAQRWNMSPNAAAALSYRAREGLRTAWLDAHVNEGLVPQECRPFVSDLGRYAQEKLSERRTAQVREHLDGCDHCPLLLAEVGSAALELRVLLLPVVLWSGVAVGGGAALGGGALGLAKWVGRLGPRGLSAGAAATVAAVAVVVAVANPWAPPPDADAGTQSAQTIGTSTGSGATSDPDDSADSADSDDTADETVGDDTAADDDPATVTPLAPTTPTAPAPSGPSTAPGADDTSDPTDDASTDPDDPTTDPADPGGPTDPGDDPDDVAAPSLTMGEQDDDGNVVLSGDGAVPGATVTVRTAGPGGPGAGERLVPPRDATLPGQVLGTAVAEDAGGWQIVLALRPWSGQAIEVVQTVGGVTSAATTATLPGYRLAPPTLQVEVRPVEAPAGEVPRSEVWVSGTGEPGATVTVTTGAGGTVVATAEVGPPEGDAEQGYWEALVDGIELAGQPVVAVQTAADGIVSGPSEGQALPMAPAAPGVAWAQITSEGEVTAQGSCQWGATVVVRTPDGAFEISDVIDGEGWVFESNDPIFDAGTQIEVYQVVDGIRSPSTVVALELVEDQLQ